METRRRVARQSGWRGRGFCLVDGEAPEGWRACEVIDISELGLGIELHYFWPSELLSRHISVKLPAAGPSVSVVLEGEIRNAQNLPGSTVRLGIEFVGVSAEELSVIGVLALAPLAGATVSGMEPYGTEASAVS